MKALLWRSRIITRNQKFQISLWANEKCSFFSIGPKNGNSIHMDPKMSWIASKNIQLVI